MKYILANKTLALIGLEPLSSDSIESFFNVLSNS